MQESGRFRWRRSEPPPPNFVAAVVVHGGVGGGHTATAATKQRIWGRFGAASNLGVNVNGRRVALEGTFDKVFLPPR